MTSQSLLQFDFSAGEFKVDGTALIIHQDPFSGIGTGGRVWDCGVGTLLTIYLNLQVLSKFLETEFPRGFWVGKRVLELGCGKNFEISFQILF
jgi:hypothetical protein